MLGFADNDFTDGGSDRLIDALVAWGDLGTIVERIQQHWAAGADHVCIQSIDPDNPVGSLGIASPDDKLLRTLAAALT